MFYDRSYQRLCCRFFLSQLPPSYCDIAGCSAWIVSSSFSMILPLPQSPSCPHETHSKSAHAALTASRSLLISSTSNALSSISIFAVVAIIKKMDNKRDGLNPFGLSHHQRYARLILSLAILKYSSSFSIPIKERSRFLHATPVVPLPIVKSSTVSPSLV